MSDFGLSPSNIHQTYFTYNKTQSYKSLQATVCNHGKNTQEIWSMNGMVNNDKPNSY